MLGNLISEIDSLRKESLSLIENLPTVELDEDEQCSFELFFKKQNLGCICTSQSFQVETSENHWAVCSNQYLALAAIGFDFAMCLKKYFDFFDACIRNNKNESDKIVDLQNAFPKACLNDLDSIDDWLNSRRCMSYLTHIANHPEDKESLCYFLSGIGTKKFGNEKKALRGTGDLFGAYVLAVFPVTTVASGFLGGLIYALTQDSEVFGKIVTSFKKAKERQNKLNKEEKKNIFEGISSFSPSQIIYYGVPGSGKSNKIKEQLKSVPEFQKIRCVFHPEYTNADFVGQIKPVVENGKVEYKFTPGPFAKILRRAYLNPSIPFYLVIEEINRGNAAAIFGDVFQLCDRIKPGDDEDESGYGLGWSSYFTENADLSDYIRDIASLEADKLESHSDAVMQTHSYSEVKDSDGNPISLNATSYISLQIKRSDLDGGELRFSENTSIRLPPNLSIYATMNTSDQNVFTLDNAFQRRFDMELVRNEFEKGDVDGFKDASVKAQHNALIEGTDCAWGDFWEKMNDKIVSLNRGLASTEDKRLGPWFVCSVAGGSDDAPRIIPAKVFAEKVLKYLWDDAFKFKRPQVFADGLSSLEQVVKKFEEASGGNLEKLKAIFKED